MREANPNPHTLPSNSRPDAPADSIRPTGRNPRTPVNAPDSPEHAIYTRVNAIDGRCSGLVIPVINIKLKDGIPVGPG
jgi:hypothetical protein